VRRRRHVNEGGGFGTNRREHLFTFGGSLKIVCRLGEEEEFEMHFNVRPSFQGHLQDFLPFKLQLLYFLVSM
jgi:hypothetical protein